MALQLLGAASGRGSRAAPLSIRTEISRDDAWVALAQSGDEQKAATILELAQRGEAELLGYLDVVVDVLAEYPSAKVKAAVCEAVRAAGAAGAAYAHKVGVLLEDQDSEVKYQACLALAGMGFEAFPFLTELRGLLSDSAEVVRYGACAALGGLEASKCVEDVAALLSDNSTEVQGAACWALGRMGQEGRQSADAVAKRLAEPRCRLQALRALALMGPKCSGPFCEDLVACLADEDPDTRAAAAAAVAQAAAAVDASPLATARLGGLLVAEDGRARIAAATAVGAMGRFGAGQADALRELLADEFSEPAATALTVGGCRPRLPATWRKASCAAALALGRIAAYTGDAASIAADIGRLLESTDWEERLSACEAAAEMRGLAASRAEAVAGLFGDSRHAVRAKAAFAYGRLGVAGASSQLVELLDDKAPAVREAATRALALLGDGAGEYIERVAERLADTAPGPRAAAAEALASLGDRGQFFASALAQRLADPAEVTAVRLAVIRALGGMGERGAVYGDLVEMFLQDPLPELQQAARQSLLQMGRAVPGGAILPIQGGGGGELE